MNKKYLGFSCYSSYILQLFYRHLEKNIFKFNQLILNGVFPDVICTRKNRCSIQQLNINIRILSKNITFLESFGRVKKVVNKQLYFFLFLLFLSIINACSSDSEFVEKEEDKDLPSIQDAIDKTQTGIVQPFSATDNTHQGKNDASYSIDGNQATIYHSNWSQSVNESNPAILTYNFQNVKRIDQVTYIPRQDGGANGNFGKVEIWVKTASDNQLKKYGSYDFGKSGDPHTVTFTGGLIQPEQIVFKVLSGYADSGGPFASCAEMVFAYVIDNTKGEYAFFSDPLMTKLKSGITKAILDTVSNPLVKALGLHILEGKYNTDYRVNYYKCILSPQALSKEWSTPGKLYDQIQGVTGINVSKGKHAVVVSGLNSGQTVPLKIVAWFSKDLTWNGTDSLGAAPAVYTYILHNGLNLFDYAGAKDGLAYICYYADSNPSSYPQIGVHIINGEVNGYLTPNKSNEELDTIVKNAKNRCIDLVGAKVHSIWEAQALAKYCKAADDKSLGYRQYMNLLDTLVNWEHQLIGLVKYKRVPENKTMAYVNYTYYMFQGSLGVTFIHSQQSRVLNCRTLMYKDADAIWGLSHEWGHQQQMQPYFCWAGQSECTNNMNSCYNILHMGYADCNNRISNAWSSIINIMENDSGHDATSKARQNAYTNAKAFNWCPELKQLALSMKGGNIASLQSNPDLGISISEVGVEPELAPLFMLYCYFTNKMNLSSNLKDYKPDFGPDLYESLRTTNMDGDKYAILAAAQNGISGKYNEFAMKYPSSVWMTHKYILPSSTRWQNSVPYIFNFCRKASLISGYNLYPYFSKFGFFRLVALILDDYGTKYIALTKSMREEFKSDMEELVKEGKVKEMPDNMVNKISNAFRSSYETPSIPN